MVHAGSSAKHIGSPPILPEPGHDKNYLLQNYEIIANLLSPPKKMSPPYGRTSSGHAESEGGITDFSQNRIAIGDTATGGSLYRLPSRTARRSSGGTAICGCEEKTLILIFTTFDCDRNHSVVRTKIRFMLWISE
ncbi:MAG: hypothetical protein K2O82_06540 [Alistipes sp.]|nr:hypothetical protein [Alistipes sp.]